MKTLDEFLEEKNWHTLPMVTKNIKKYYAYKKGESFGPYNTLGEARCISTNTETVEYPNPDYPAYEEALKKNKVLLEELKKEYNTYQLIEFGLCFDEFEAIKKLYSDMYLEDSITEEDDLIILSLLVEAFKLGKKWDSIHFNPAG